MNTTIRLCWSAGLVAGAYMTGTLINHLRTRHEYGLILLLALVIFIVCAKIMQALDNETHRHQLAGDVQPDEPAPAGAGDQTATTASGDRSRQPTGLPKFVPGSSAPAPKTAQAASVQTPGTTKPVYCVELRKRLKSGEVSTWATYNAITYEYLGSKGIAQIKTYIEDDADRHSVRITPYFDQRMWNLEQRQNRVLNAASVAVIFPRYLLKNVEGLIC